MTNSSLLCSKREGKYSHSNFCGITRRSTPFMCSAPVFMLAQHIFASFLVITPTQNPSVAAPALRSVVHPCASMLLSAALGRKAASAACFLLCPTTIQPPPCLMEQGSSLSPDFYFFVEEFSPGSIDCYRDSFLRVTNLCTVTTENLAEDEDLFTLRHRLSKTVFLLKVFMNILVNN